MQAACACVQAVVEGRKTRSFSSLRSMALVILPCLRECAPLSLTSSTSWVSRPDGAEAQEMDQPQSLSQSYPFPYLCPITAASVSHLLGSVSFLPRSTVFTLCLPGDIQLQSGHSVVCLFGFIYF